MNHRRNTFIHSQAGQVAARLLIPAIAAIVVLAIALGFIIGRIS